MKKICIITGGSKGLGKELVQMLSELGYITVYTYTKKPKIFLPKIFMASKMNSK